MEQLSAGMRQKSFLLFITFLKPKCDFLLEGKILHEVKAFYPRTQITRITRISLNFSDFFLPIPAPGKMSSHFEISKFMKFSTSMTRTHQSEEVFGGRDTRMFSVVTTVNEQT